MEEIRECLLIDDDLDDQEIFEMCIRRIAGNIICTVMDNGVDAISMLNSNIGYTPDYIFLDVNMPKMNGIEVLKNLRSIARLRNAKIYMYSTTSEKTFLEESKKLGADGFIMKPSKMAELKEKLSKIFMV